MRQQDQDEPPLSFTQQRLWFLDQLVPGSAADHLQAVLSFKGSLDVAILKQCVTEIVQRYEILRTSFSLIDSQAIARVETLAFFNIPFIDLSTLSTEQQDVEFRRLAVREAQTHFDLGRANLFRLVLLRFQADDQRLLLTAHRMIADEESLKVFGRELVLLYGNPAFPELPAQFRDFSKLQSESLRGSALSELQSWWKTRLEGIAPLELPADHPRPAAQSDRVETLRFAIPPKLISSNELSNNSQQTFFLSAFSALLSRYAAAQDFVIGLESANRPLHWARLIGPLANLLPLRLVLSGELTFRQLLARAWRDFRRESPRQPAF